MNKDLKLLIYFFLLLVLCINVFGYVDTTKLVAYYQFEDASNTLLKNNVSSLYNFSRTAGTVNVNQTGIIGKSIFITSSGYISTPTGFGLNNTQNLNLSINLWINNITGANYNSFFSDATDDLSDYLWGVDLTPNPDNHYFIVENQGITGGSYSKQINLNLTGWRMFTLTVNTNTSEVKVYYNGNSINITNVSGSLKGNNVLPTSAYQIGRDRNGARYLTGYIDEYSIFSRILNQTEITELYNNGTGLLLTNQTQPVSSQCIYTTGNFIIENTTCNITSNYNLLQNNISIFNSTIYSNATLTNYSSFKIFGSSIYIRKTL